MRTDPGGVSVLPPPFISRLLLYTAVFAQYPKTPIMPLGALIWVGRKRRKTGRSQNKCTVTCVGLVWGSELQACERLRLEEGDSRWAGLGVGGSEEAGVSGLE